MESKDKKKPRHVGITTSKTRDFQKTSLDKIKKLFKHGNGYSLGIDKVFVEAVNADIDTLFRVHVDNGSIVATPVKDNGESINRYPRYDRDKDFEIKIFAGALSDEEYEDLLNSLLPIIKDTNVGYTITAKELRNNEPKLI